MSTDDILDALLSVPVLGSAAISPDGRWAAWTWLGAGAHAEVYIAPTDGSAPPVQLTASDQNTRLVSWAPDSRSVVVTQDHDGDERYQLFRVDLARPLAMEPLTEPEPPYFLRGGRLHPNGQWLIYAMNYDVAAGHEIEPTWLYRHDLTTGERTVLGRPERASYFEPALNDAGTHILYNRQDLDPAGSQVWLVDIDGRDDREILNFGPATKVSASWLPEGRRVLFVAECGSYRRVGLWDMETEDIHWLIDDPARNIEEAWAPRGTVRPLIVVAEIVASRIHCSFVDLTTGIETHLPDHPGSLVPLRPVPAGGWIGRYYRSTSPEDLVRFHPEAIEPPASGVTGIWHRVALQREDLTPAEDFRWRSDDGLEIQGWLYRPQGTARGTIVLVHGGPTSHSEDAFSAATQYYVSQGFAVLQPNYRGSTGFGLAFEESIKADGWGGREQDDIRTGIEALIAGGHAEPGKVGITGTSYGGYSSWCAITRFPPEIVAAAAPICGMTDLVVDYETTRPDLRPYSEEMMGGRPEEIPERYRERSPIHFVDRIRGRLLIVQGLRDPNVTPSNVQVVREALEGSGIPYDILTFADEGHGIALPANRKILYRRLVEFFTDAFG